MSNTLTTDTVIVGGGPAGSAAAMRLLAHGVTPTIVERETFPRFHIGESMTAECGRLVCELGLEQAMLDAGYPIKHGVRVFGPKGDTGWWVPVMQRDETGVLQPRTTWQVRRSSFDKLMFDTAISRGARLVSGTAVEANILGNGALGGVSVRTDGEATLAIDAPMTLDCSGQATFLANRKVTGPKYLGSYDKQIAFFTHVAGYRRDHAPADDRVNQPGNTHIFYKQKYQWAWGIPISDDIVSVGVVVPAAYFRATGESKEQFLRRELGELNPALAERVGDPDMREPVRVVPNYSFQVRGFAGPGFVCVGDAHRFVDPIFSFGMNISIKEAFLAADLVVAQLSGAGGPDDLAAHMVTTESATDVLEDVLDTFWENPIAFSVFVHDRYRESMIDAFAGRIYGDNRANEHFGRALAAFRRLLRRERSYDGDGEYSVPIGSRFHPERAPLWNAELDAVATTERWMRDQD